MSINRMRDFRGIHACPNALLHVNVMSDVAEGICYCSVQEALYLTLIYIYIITHYTHIGGFSAEHCLV